MVTGAGRLPPYDDGTPRGWAVLTRGASSMSGPVLPPEAQLRVRSLIRTSPVKTRYTSFTPFAPETGAVAAAHW